jgi:hypothetical protein
MRLIERIKGLDSVRGCGDDALRRDVNVGLKRNSGINCRK